MQFVIEDITEIIEDFINDHELEKGLKRGEVIRLKSAIDLLESYESMLPDDVLAAIRDILKFAMSLSDGKKKEESDEDESSEEDRKVKKRVAHDWGFSLAPSFEKEDESRSRRRKIRKKKGGKKHEWGFSFADLDIKKEDEDLDQEDEEDEED